MSIQQFLEEYPPEVKTLIGLVRDYLIKSVPGLQEELDLPSKILIYRVAPGVQGIVFTLIPSKKGVRLGFYRGRELEDPARLLAGKGKIHASTPLNESLFKNPDFQSLVLQAAKKTFTRINMER